MKHTKLAANAKLVAAVLLAAVLLAGAVSGGGIGRALAADVATDNSATYTLAEELDPADVFTVDGDKYWVGETGMTPGTPIHIGNADYTHGVSFHPAAEGPAYLTYNVEGLGFMTFYAVVGKDRASGRDVGGDNGIRGTKVCAEVWVDGVKAAESGELPYPETYTFKVNIKDAKEVKLVVTDGGDSIYCDTTSWGNALFSQESVETFKVPSALAETTATEAPTEEPTPAPTNPPDIADRDMVYLSDIEWKAAEIYPAANGGVPARDGNVADEELWICGTYYPKGICMHARPGANAFMEIDLDGLGFNTFAAYAGTAESDLHDVTMASVRFIFIVDGEEKLRTDVLKADTEPTLVTVDIAGAKLLRIELDNVDGISGDWGALGSALLSKATDASGIFATPTPAPTAVPTATPAPTSAPASGAPTDTSENGTAAPASGGSNPGGSSGSNTSGGSKAGLIAGIAAGALALIAGVIAIVMVNKKKKGS